MALELEVDADVEVVADGVVEVVAVAVVAVVVSLLAIRLGGMVSTLVKVEQRNNIGKTHRARSAPPHREQQARFNVAKHSSRPLRRPPVFNVKIPEDWRPQLRSPSLQCSVANFPELSRSKVLPPAVLQRVHTEGPSRQATFAGLVCVWKKAYVQRS